MLLPAAGGKGRKVSWRDRFRIREGVSGGLLECGCAFGRYLTYSRSILTIVDDASGCGQGHSRGLILAEDPAGEPPGTPVFRAPDAKL